MAESAVIKSSPEQFRNWEPVGKGLIRRGKLIAKGGESVVYKGSFERDFVALKVVSNHATSNETNVLHNLDHPNVIKFLYNEKVDTQIYIVLELCCCNLDQYIKKGGQEMCEISLTPVEVLEQIVAGVHYLHNGQTFLTVHRDLKPSNILFKYVKRDQEWRVKISDFGLSKDIDRSKSSTNTDVKGSSGFMAPEVLKFMLGPMQKGTSDKMKIKKEADIFSLGIIFYFTLSNGEHPFGNDPLKHDENIRDGEPNMVKLKPEYECDSKDLILTMLQKEPDKRVTVGAIKAHFLFWKPKKTLEFYQNVSDILNAKGKHHDVKCKLEIGCTDITKGNWQDELKRGKPAIAANFEKGKKTAKPTIIQLIRKIRNWGHHYDEEETPEELKLDLGSYPDGMMDLFKERFPQLLPHAYDVMKVLQDIQRLKEYYDVSDTIPRPRKGVIEDGLACRFPGALEDSDDILALDSGDDMANEGEVPDIVPRNYQLELAEPAKQGCNSLIIAPTGSGKTVVAYEIIRHHLQQSHAKSVLFFVSKTTLALQQHRFFELYLKQLDDGKIGYIIGENSTHAPTGAVLKGRRLLILTPQILINELKRSRTSIKFSDFSLLIFDECHNATKKHPYKQVMDLFLDSQSQESVNVQIIGMTASPGVGRGKTREKVLENLITLLANLNITDCPVTVEKNIDELKKHQNEIKETHMRVRIHEDQYSKKILKAIDLIEKEIQAQNMFGNTANQISEPPYDKTKQSYEMWVIELIKHVKMRVTIPERARTVSIYAEHLQMYYNLLYLKKHIPRAIDFTNNAVSIDQDSSQGELLRRINLELERSSINSKVPMLEKLFEELRKQFNNDPDSRCIIFVPRKLIAKALADSIKNDETLNYLKPEYLTGSNDHVTSGGMTKPEQASALEVFRTGKCKVLISTSVAEEGLDIRACNLVIMYNYVTGEVGRIQRAGRGRAENSRSILIAPYGSEQIEQERKNEDCARASEDAISDLRVLSDNERIKRILKTQRKQASDRQKEREQSLRLLQEAKKWRVLCGSCQTQITTADQISEIKGKHKFVVDPEFAGKVHTKKIYDGKEISPGFTGTARFNCKDRKCNHYLGLEMQYKSKKFPTLKAEQLIFEDEYGERQTCKQWKKCKFQIEKYPDESDDEDEDLCSQIAPIKLKTESSIVSADTISNDTAFEYLDNWNHFVRD